MEENKKHYSMHNSDSWFPLYNFIIPSKLQLLIAAAMNNLITFVISAFIFLSPAPVYINIILFLLLPGISISITFIIFYKTMQDIAARQIISLLSAFKIQTGTQQIMEFVHTLEDTPKSIIIENYGVLTFEPSSTENDINVYYKKDKAEKY